MFRYDALLSDQIEVLRQRLSPPPTAEELWQEAQVRAQTYSIRRQRVTYASVAVACVSGLAMSAGLIVAANSAHDPAEASDPYRAEPPSAGVLATPGSSSVPVLPSSGSRLPSYKEVVLHFVSFDGANPIKAQDRDADAVKTEAAMDVLGEAYKGHWDIGDAPVRAEVETYDLNVDGLSIKVACGEAPGSVTVDNLSHQVWTSLGKQTLLAPDVLDIVVMEVGEGSCWDIPVGEMTDGDIVIYRDKKVTEAGIAHETNHTTNYGHDNQYHTEPDGNNVIKLDANTGQVMYGNAGTLQGDGARVEKVTDKDPLTAYQMLLGGVITPEQVVTVPESSAMDIELSALTADDTTHPVKAVNMPLSPENRPGSGTSAIMLELSYEAGELTVKAYGAGMSTQDGVAYNATALIPLTADALNGLSRDNLNKPRVIDLGGEQITLTVKTIGTGDNARATVSVSRS